MQSSTAKTEAELAKDRYGSDKLDKHSFLKLLTEQLRHQDPLKPMDNMEFLMQQAAFTQIEELQNLTSAINNGNAMTQSSALIGKQVTVANPDNPEQTYSGIVQAAFFANGNAAIQIDGMKYPIESVVGVQEPGTTTETE
jgi:flagellar basal-body rod modification protein FlgD